MRTRNPLGPPDRLDRDGAAIMNVITDRFSLSLSLSLSLYFYLSLSLSLFQGVSSRLIFTDDPLGGAASDSDAEKKIRTKKKEGEKLAERRSISGFFVCLFFYSFCFLN